MLGFSDFGHSPRVLLTAGGLLVVGLLSACSPAQQSQPEADVQVTATLADYERAEQFLSVNANPLVSNLILRQYWQPNDRLVYHKSTPDGS